MPEQILRDIQQNGWFLKSYFLSQEELAPITRFFDEKKNEFQAAKIGKDRQRILSVRGDLTYWIDPLNPPEVMKPLLNFLQDLQNDLNLNFFLGLKEFECHLALYPPGTFYQKHLDRFSKDSSRSFSFIFYLNDTWSEEDGGELILYDKGGGVVKVIYPTSGTFVGFLSEEFPHEVKASQKERKSFTGWMHTRIIY